MLKKVVTKEQAGVRPFALNVEGDVVSYLESVKDAAEHLGESCINPVGESHPLYSVSADGYVECPREFKYLISEIRLENYEPAATPVVEPTVEVTEPIVPPVEEVK